MLSLPKSANQFTKEQKQQALQQLIERNGEDQSVIKFVNSGYKTAFKTSDFQKQFEKYLQFKLLPLQTLCLNYILESSNKRLFINLGMGNGKTLLTTCSAIYLAKKHESPVFIIGKNDHLIQRDERQFETLIQQFNLRVNVNEYENKSGLYYLTQMDFETYYCLDPEFQSLLAHSSIVIDEHDWILFDGAVPSMLSLIKHALKAKQLIAMTGSRLRMKEKQIIETFFKAEEIDFPVISSINGNKKQHLADEVVVAGIQDYFKKLDCIIQKYSSLVPIIIVASSSYQMLENWLKKQSKISFVSGKLQRGCRIEATLESGLCTRDKHGKFGVYMLSETQGRGTDIKTSQEIEKNGGLYLIMADIFHRRVQDQIVGRVGRLDNKGQWHYLVYSQGNTSTIEQLVRLKQEQKDNENHFRLLKLHQGLSQEYENQAQIETQVPCSSEMQLNQIEASKHAQHLNKENDASFSDSTTPIVTAISDHCDQKSKHHQQVPRQKGEILKTARKLFDSKEELKHSMKSIDELPTQIFKNTDPKPFDSSLFTPFDETRLFPRASMSMNHKRISASDKKLILGKRSLREGEHSYNDQPNELEISSESETQNSKPDMETWLPQQSPIASQDGSQNHKLQTNSHIL